MGKLFLVICLFYLPKWCNRLGWNLILRGSALTCFQVNLMYVRFETLMAVTIKIMVFRGYDDTLYSGAVSHPRKQSSLKSIPLHAYSITVIRFITIIEYHFYSWDMKLCLVSWFETVTETLVVYKGKLLNNCSLLSFLKKWNGYQKT